MIQVRKHRKVTCLSQRLIASNESHYTLCRAFIDYFLLGNTTTDQLILNEEEKETTVDLNSQDIGEKSQKSDIPVTLIDG